MIKGIDYLTKMYFKSLFSVTLWVVRFHIGQHAATSMTVIFFYTYSLVVSFQFKTDLIKLITTFLLTEMTEHLWNKVKIYHSIYE